MRNSANRLRRLATVTAVAVALLLVAIKLAAWLMTDSVALLSSLIDSSLDATASLVNLLAVYYAAKPADREHLFGHGKLEPLAGVGQTLFIGASGTLILSEAVPRLFDPEPVDAPTVGVVVMLVSMALTLGLVRFQRYVVRKTASVAVDADSLHYTGDLLMNAGIVISLLLSDWLGLHILDPIFAIGIAIYVLYTAIRIARSSLDLLMDRELPDEERAEIEAICLRHREVRGVHDLRTRSSGVHKFIQLHLELDGDAPLRNTHDVSFAVAASIRAAFPDAEVIIHQDPV